jgi:hypothetical protein
VKTKQKKFFFFKREIIRMELLNSSYYIYIFKSYIISYNSAFLSETFLKIWKKKIKVLKRNAEIKLFQKNRMFKGN